MNRTVIVSIWLMVGTALAQKPDLPPYAAEAIVAGAYGSIVWQDDDAGVIVGVAKEGGRVVTVQIEAYKSGVNLKLHYLKPGEPPEVEYRSGTLGPPIHLASWQDLNGDGVFDRRVLLGEWPLLTDGSGRTIWLGGKWIAVRQAAVTGNSPTAVGIDGKQYRFDRKLGRWIPDNAATTQPSK